MNTRRALTVLVLAAVLVLALAAPAFGAPVRKIVVFRAGFLNAKALQGLEKRGATIIKPLPLVDGAAVCLPDAASQRAIESLGEVAWVSDDIEVHALDKPANVGKPQPPAPVPQAVQWGVTKIGANLAWPTTTADAVKVGIIDTGIDVDHPDLAGNIKGGATFVARTSSFDDDNGHGTHVAGIVAAQDNTIGVVGVAPKADLYGIKVLNRRGSGYLSDVVSGLDWAVTNGMQVVNMSLGAQADDPTLALAVSRTAAAGVIQVAAAGNDGPGAVDYPGAYPQVIAVGATDSNDAIASWSSVGPQVAVSAPGVSVYSTYKGGGYATMSGTSMATPHATGTVALMLANGVAVGDIKAKLESTALDLGAGGFDNYYGWGRIRADLAYVP